MSRKIVLNVKGESIKQYSTLILELNQVAKSWSKVGVDIKLPGQEKIIEWGNRKHKGDVPAETSD